MTQRWADSERPRRSFAGRLGSAAAAACWAVAVGVVIDMVVAAILMSLGMMMLPPAMVSLPFKLIFFVLVDGWFLVAGSLVQSFGIS